MASVQLDEEDLLSPQSVTPGTKYELLLDALNEVLQDEGA
jgi:hypothetical protein